LSSKGLARFLTEWGEHMVLSRPEAVIQGHEQLGTPWRSDDSPSSPIRRVGAAFDQVCRFKVVEQIGHDRAIYAEVLGQGELASNHSLGGSGEHLVTAWSAR
jgi:hypothetical protein